MNLTDLLRYSLFQGSQPTDAIGTDWDALFEESKNEGVSALTLDAIGLLAKEERPSRERLLQWGSMTANIEESYNRNAQACRTLQQLFWQKYPECGERPIPVVKGLKTASSYPIPSHREFGDVDIYSANHTDKITSLMEGHGISVDNSDKRHTSFIYLGAHFEAHRYLFYNKEDNLRLEELIATEGGLDQETHALFVAAHMERHSVFFNEGMSIKDLVDWGMMIRTINYERFSAIKKGFEVERFADLLTLYCCQLWGLTIPNGCPTMTPAHIKTFHKMFVERSTRKHWAVARVFSRSMKYLRYNKFYKDLYGQSMFSRFYLANIQKALRQMLRGEKREVRH